LALRYRRFTIRWMMVTVALLAPWLVLLRYNRPLAVLIAGTAGGGFVQRAIGRGWVVGAVTGGMIAYVFVIPRLS
jgi:hypothetical protein